MNDAEARLRLLAFIKRHGTQDTHGAKSRAARALGISPQYLGQILADKRPMSKTVLDGLGLAREVTIRAKKILKQTA